MKTLNSILTLDQLRYVEDVSPAEMSRRLIAGISNGLVVVACSEMDGVDSKFPDDPELPFYIWQNLGACVSDSIGLETVVEDKGITDVVVFGHTHCGLIEAGLDTRNRNQFPESLYSQLCSRTEATRHAALERFGEKFDREVDISATKDFVIRQSACLLTMDTVLRRAESGLLRVHTWILNSENSEVETFNPAKRVFETIWS
ncbi:MAG: carbonic anhydrase [Candidatus Melainabacteria bacterium]|nr:carbonic anhydrase [Candidatus Melainabacteria bacterium]